MVGKAIIFASLLHRLFCYTGIQVYILPIMRKTVPTKYCTCRITEAQQQLTLESGVR